MRDHALFQRSQGGAGRGHRGQGAATETWVREGECEHRCNRGWRAKPSETGAGGENLQARQTEKVWALASSGRRQLCPW